MSAGKNIMVIPTIIFLILISYLALTLKNNSTKVIGAVIVEPGFNNLQPQINGRHYLANGQYTMNIRSFSRTPLHIIEIKLQDKATQKQCNTTLITRTNALNYKETASVSAKCPKRTLDEVYLLSAEINYRFANGTELHQETGDIFGDVET
jgi:hypothetical protein